jgi:hypothetical protein
VRVINDLTVTATIPAHPDGTVDVTVTTPAGTSPVTAADRFTYDKPAPTITALTPTQGPAAGGTQVTITGTDFSGATAVAFGTTPATTFTVNSDTSITATAPAGSGTVDVTVTTPAGTSPVTAADRYTYTPDGTRLTAEPVLFSISLGQLTLNLRLSATLTDTVTGRPVPGQTITFSVGGTTVCSAITDSHGTATCQGLCPVLAALLNLRYTATFAGTPTLAPATATAPLIRIL